MALLDPSQQPLEEWRPGVMTRMRVAAVNGARSLCVFEQFCEPGMGAPTHTHAVEEVLTVLAGRAEIWVGGARYDAGAGQCVLIAAQVPHGFRNSGDGVLHMQAIVAAPVFEAVFNGGLPPRRCWDAG